jgi:two-component sensor histidine kinase
VRAISSMVAGHAMWDDPRWERAHGNAMRHIVARLDDLESLQDVAKNEWRAGAEMFSIREAVEAVSDVAAAHAITIHVEAPDLLIFSDRARLEQVLLNLLENGVRHARTRVDVAATLLEDTLAVVVKDDGLGLPKDFAELVLTGVQGDLPGRGGLGLAFVKETVRAHGGALAAISHGHGAEFRFTWRIEMTDVLIVDDDPLWHNLTRELLADHGLTSVVASTLSEAARHWARVAMIDLALGQDDGRGAPQLLAMPCYVHSGSPDEDLPPGFAGRLNKPIEARDIAVLRFAAVSPALAHPPQP